jgi:hypothetical protein
VQLVSQVAAGLRIPPYQEQQQQQQQQDDAKGRSSKPNGSSKPSSSSSSSSSGGGGSGYLRYLQLTVLPSQPGGRAEEAPEQQTQVQVRVLASVQQREV